MYKIICVAMFVALAACSTPNNETNPKDIPVDTGAQPQNNVIVSAPPGTMGHGRF